MKQIGDIQLFAEICRSSQSVVYKGFQQTLDRTVFVKMLPSILTQDAPARLAFQQEAKLIAQIEHPNIVTIFDFGQNEEGCYFITEFIEYDLSALIASGPLPAELAVYIARQICQGLKAAHAQKILHKDIKPGNILISPGGEVKLADFGLAVDARGESNMDDVISGTVEYLPPEIILGEKAAEPSDIFSLGATLFEMLCGEKAFARDSTEACLSAILNHDPVPYLHKIDRLPDKLAQVCSRMLKKDSVERYQMCQPLLRDLTEVASLYEQEVTKEHLAGFLQNRPQYKPVQLISAKRPQISSQGKPTNSRAWVLALLILTTFVMATIILTGSSFLRKGEDNREVNLKAQGFAIQDTAGKEKNAAPEETFNAAPVEQVSAPQVENQTSNGAVDHPKTDGIEVTAQPVLSYGGLQISCQPWGNVFINRDSVGVTPFDEPLKLPVGEYTVVIKNEEFPDYQVLVNVVENKINRIDFSFWTLVAKLELDVSPWAEIYIDDVYKDTVPPQARPIILPPGAHELALKHPTLGVWRTEVLAVAGESITLKFNLKDLLN